MIWTTLLFCHIATGVVSAILARKRNRRAYLWFLVTLPLGVLALFLLLLLAPRTRSPTPPKTD